MLSQQEKDEIDKEIAKVPIRKSAGLKALIVVQRHRGYISDLSLKEVASYIDISPTELDGIATFYNLIYRKPVGRHVIRLCDSISCWIMGYEKVKNKISDHLKIDFGQTTEDKCFTLLPAQCLGTCDHAPAMMINEELYRDLTIDNVKPILEQYQKKSLNEEEVHATPSDRTYTVSQ